MKRIIKNAASEVITKDLRYIIKRKNSELSKLLLNEQKRFCAYTEEYIGINDAVDIEHFNPNLKGKIEDSYNNWFSVKHKPNNRKRSNWLDPMLHPCSEDFEERILYIEGLYICNPNDAEATNLIALLNLNEEIFVKHRVKYIKRREERIEELNITPFDYFKNKIEKDIDQIKYLRAIQDVFKIDIWNMIPEIKD